MATGGHTVSRGRRMVGCWRRRERSAACSFGIRVWELDWRHSRPTRRRSGRRRGRPMGCGWRLAATTRPWRCGVCADSTLLEEVLLLGSRAAGSVAQLVAEVAQQLVVAVIGYLAVGAGAKAALETAIDNRVGEPDG